MVYVIMGDFNEYAPYSSLWNNTMFDEKYKNMFTDAFEYCIKENSINSDGLTNVKLLKTFHGWEGDSYVIQKDHERGRIDWFLTNGNIDQKTGIEITNCQVVRQTWKSSNVLKGILPQEQDVIIYPSDHFPVVLTFQLHM